MHEVKRFLNKTDLDVSTRFDLFGTGIVVVFSMNQQDQAVVFVAGMVEIDFASDSVYGPHHQ